MRGQVLEFRRHLGLITTLLVVIATGSLLFGFSVGASGADRMALTATRLGAVIESVHATETDVNVGLAPAAAAADVRRQVTTAQVLLEQLSADAGLNRGLVPAFHAFDRALEQEFDLLLKGEVSSADALDRTLVDPTYVRLRTVLDRVTGQEVSDAASASKWLSDGSILVLVIAGGLIAVFVWRGRRRVVRDATEIAQARATEASERRFRALVDNGDDVIVVTDADATIQSISNSVSHVLGVDPAPRIGRRVTDLVHPDEVTAAEAEFAQVLSGGRAGPSPWRCRNGAGEWRNIEVTWTNMLEVPEVSGVVLNLRDVTDRRRLEEELRHRAFHDSLTGLANRALLRDRINHAMAGRGASRGALLVIDLDGFKHLNDSLGHPAGDRALAVVADRLLAVSRPHDTVARLGGDEFAVFIEDAASAADVQVFGDRLIATVAQPFSWEEHTVTVGASVGIAFIQPGVRSADDLVRNADVGLYAAKEAGRGRTQVFDATLFDAARTRYELEHDLRTAIDADELVLHYQPIVTLDTAEITGVEALVRWQHPTRGLLGPDQFIPIAEETGLIIPAGRWILEHACRDLARWIHTHAVASSFYVSINVSARQLDDPEFVGDVERALSDSGIDAHQVVLEITETALMRDRDAALDQLKALKALGVRLSVDDFGTGYSSLSYLRQFPVDIVKIDKSFVDNITAGRDDATFVGAILRLSETLHLDTLAEGIETQDQADTLEGLGCHLGQGFHYARPLGPDQIDALLHERASRIPSLR